MEFQDIALKDMDSAMLVLAIQQATNYDKDVIRALELAAYCHKDKRRANPTRNSEGVITQPTSPYIEHPLRVALRVIRWGITETETIIAAILHDTVEDHADKICELFEKSLGIITPPYALRFNATQYVVQEFGNYVGMLVSKLTNNADFIRDRERRNAAYVAKVKQEINNYEVFIIKLSDFCDNALGLHHQQDNPKMVKRLAEKYIGLVPVFVSQFCEFQSQGIDFHPDLIRRLNKAQSYLEGFINA